jgi:hypothetical protein
MQGLAWVIRHSIPTPVPRIQHAMSPEPSHPAAAQAARPHRLCIVFYRITSANQHTHHDTLSKNVPASGIWKQSGFPGLP